jgi:transcriptional regulator with XRE-family HTH domain
MQTLRALREAKGLTQTDLASRSGITQAAVSLFETGALPGRQSQNLLADVLGVTPDEIAWDGLEWQLAEAARLIGIAQNRGGREPVLEAVRLLSKWLGATRKQREEDDDAA